MWEIKVRVTLWKEESHQVLERSQPRKQKLFSPLSFIPAQAQVLIEPYRYMYWTKTALKAGFHKIQDKTALTAGFHQIQDKNQLWQLNSTRSRTKTSSDSWIPLDPGEKPALTAAFHQIQDSISQTHQAPSMGASTAWPTGSCSSSKRQKGYFRGEWMLTGQEKLPGIVVFGMWKGSFKARAPLPSNYKDASVTHWVWKVLMDDSNTINFQSFFQFVGGRKTAPKATSAAPVPSQGHEADTARGVSSITALGDSSHQHIPQSSSPTAKSDVGPETGISVVK